MEYAIGFIGGFIFGLLARPVLSRRFHSSQAEIEIALDTVGIRRVEFLKVKRDLDLVYDEMREMNLRMRVIESSQK